MTKRIRAEQNHAAEVVRNLLNRGKYLMARPPESVRFTGDPDADLVLNDLERYPHAFVLGCVMDRQIKAERAWLIPYTIMKRRGSLKFNRLRTLSLRTLKSWFSKPESLHRFPDAMATYFHSALQLIAEEYRGDAALIWSDRPSSATAVRRFLAFDGVGPKIATMAANILVRNFKVPVSDKISIDISPDVQVQRTFMRLGLLRPGASTTELIYRARELHPRYPGVFDSPAWEIGRNWCKARAPECDECSMGDCCPTALSRKSRRGRA